MVYCSTLGSHISETHKTTARKLANGNYDSVSYTHTNTPVVVVVVLFKVAAAAAVRNNSKFKIFYKITREKRDGSKPTCIDCNFVIIIIYFFFRLSFEYVRASGFTISE